jgi:ABC-type Na+ transport system ATPase subunit NatA
MVRTLGTLLCPTSGSAMVAGLPLTSENEAEIRRRISVMPESPGLYLRLSVAENLACFADLYEVPDPRDRVRRALRTARRRRVRAIFRKELREHRHNGFDVIHATLGLALGLAAALLLGDGLGWRIMAATFDRERLITGTR